MGPVCATFLHEMPRWSMTFGLLVVRKRSFGVVAQGSVFRDPAVRFGGENCSEPDLRRVWNARRACIFNTRPIRWSWIWKAATGRTTVRDSLESRWTRKLIDDERLEARGRWRKLRRRLRSSNDRFTRYTDLFDAGECSCRVACWNLELGRSDLWNLSLKSERIYVEACIVKMGYDKPGIICYWIYGLVVMFLVLLDLIFGLWQRLETILLFSLLVTPH